MKGHELLRDDAPGPRAGEVACVETGKRAGKTGKRSPRNIRPVVPENWRQMATLTVDEYAVLMRVNRTGAYEAVKRGQVKSIPNGKRRLIPVPWLIRKLEGLD
jgi:pyruvate/2-oxoacid:ferredoxin oxidoreductase alpha subunit